MEGCRRDAVYLRIRLKLLIMAEKSKGLGDTVEKFTALTGIKSAAEALAKIRGKDCGCAKRKEALNKAFPYEK